MTRAIFFSIISDISKNKYLVLYLEASRNPFAHVQCNGNRFELSAEFASAPALINVSITSDEPPIKKEILGLSSNNVFQLIKQPIFRIPNILFVYFLSIFSR